MSNFKIGECYSRVDINKELHGGGLQNSIIHKNGSILAACFKLSLNPDAPETVLIRSGEHRDMYQEILEKTSGCSFPLFLYDDLGEYRDEKNWEYMGEFKCAGTLINARDIISYLKGEGLSDEVGNIVAVAHMRKAFEESYVTRKKAA